MVDFKRYKWPLISIGIIICVLILIMSIGYTIGILSEDPDGLEKVLITFRGESWLEGLVSPWIPILSWIDNDYIAGIIGILLSTTIIVSVFYLFSKIKKKNR
ncbi:MAG: hypothetical protein ACTSRH_02790 [Promethearchaeota archaeon]